MNKIKKALLSFSLISILGCQSGNYVICDEKNNHVHKYVSKNGLEMYVWQESDKELDSFNSFKRTDDIIRITSEDEKYFKILNDNHLVKLDPKNNINMDYIYKQLNQYSHDYLEFYYHYTTTETYTTTDENGKKETHTRTDHHYGWSTDPYDFNNTGDVRVCHRCFKVIKIEKNEKGEFIKKELIVDDPQKYWDEYQYFVYPSFFNSTPNIEEYISKNLKFKKKELPYLNVDEITPFENIDTTTQGYQNWLNRTSLYFNEEEQALSQKQLIKK